MLLRFFWSFSADFSFFFAILGVFHAFWCTWKLEGHKGISKGWAEMAIPDKMYVISIFFAGFSLLGNLIQFVLIFCIIINILQFACHLWLRHGRYPSKRRSLCCVERLIMVPATYRPLLWDSGCAVANFAEKFSKVSLTKNCLTVANLDAQNS